MRVQDSGRGGRYGHGCSLTTLTLQRRNPVVAGFCAAIGGKDLELCGFSQAVISGSLYPLSIPAGTCAILLA